jgi:hypothetical protein
VLKLHFPSEKTRIGCTLFRGNYVSKHWKLFRHCLYRHRKLLIKQLVILANFTTLHMGCTTLHMGCTTLYFGGTTLTPPERNTNSLQVYYILLSKPQLKLSLQQLCPNLFEDLSQNIRYSNTNIGNLTFPI